MNFSKSNTTMFDLSKESNGLIVSGIYSFSGENSFLSNMFVLNVPIEDEYGIVYHSSENYYQAHKTDDYQKRKQISQMTPKESKKNYNLSYDLDIWHRQMKVGVMRDALKLKFKNNQELSDRLILTGDKLLVEGNNWNDTFWGVCRGIGRNVLGCLLMERRMKIHRKKSVDMFQHLVSQFGNQDLLSKVNQDVAR